jgi:hypothetical protein
LIGANWVAVIRCNVCDISLQVARNNFEYLATDGSNQTVLSCYGIEHCRALKLASAEYGLVTNRPNRKSDLAERGPVHREIPTHRSIGQEAQLSLWEHRGSNPGVHPLREGEQAIFLLL